MKNLMIAAAIAILIVGGSAFFAVSVLGDYARKEKELQKDYDARVTALRATNTRFSYTPGKTLDAARFAVYLEARTAVAREFAIRIQEHSKNTFHARRTHNALLAVLRAQLNERKMSLKEYRTIAARWRALLARKEFGGLQEMWRATVNTERAPEGLPLPPPANDAQPAELELIRKNKKVLEETLHADLLDPLLDEIAAG